MNINLIINKRLSRWAVPLQREILLFEFADVYRIEWSAEQNRITGVTSEAANRLQGDHRSAD